jgi:ABC-2 type transport system ATP-binding protein
VTAAPAIETRELTKRYGRSRGIDELSFSVERGEVFGFLGPNGAAEVFNLIAPLGPRTS